MNKIVLVGYMGSGKTTVGENLSKEVLMPFYDLDNAIEHNMGMSIPEIFETKGEIFFRNKEKEVLFDLLQSKQPMIIATGGGTPCYGTIMDDLKLDKDIVVIYLQVPLDELTDRLWNEKSYRPLISHLETKEILNDFIRKHIFERSYYYSKAHHTISVSKKTPQEIVSFIRSLLF